MSDAIPSDIPHDVLAMAKKYSMNDDVLVAVCRAILAERERCAKVAEDAAKEFRGDADLWLKDQMPMASKNSSLMAISADTVAERILSGPS